MRKLLLLVLSLLLTGCGNQASTVETAAAPDAVLSRSAELSVPLATGWNPVGFQGLRVSGLQAGGAVGLAYFEDGAYRTGPVTDAEVNEGQGGRRGFWIFANAPGTLTYVAEEEASSLTLRNGWNLVSFARGQELAGSELRAERAGQSVALNSVVLPQFVELNASENLTVDVGAGGLLKPGRAYWVFAAADVVLSWTNPAPSPSPSPVTPVLSPTSASLTVGATQAFTLSLAGQAVPAQWSSDNAAVASVDAAGVVTANGVGQATVTATREGQAFQAQVTVTGGGGGGGGGGGTPAPTPTPTPTPVFKVIANQCHLRAVAYGNGRHVIVGEGARKSSTDGVTWTVHLGASRPEFGLCFDGTRFVSVGDGGVIHTSLDGLTWTARTSPTTDALRAVAAGGGVVVAGGDAGTVVRSTDGGVTWTASTQSTQAITQLTYGNGVFVAKTTSELLTSADGATWTTFDAGLGLFGATFDGTQHLAVGKNFISGQTRRYTSADGSSWTQTVIASLPFQPYVLTRGPGLLVGVGNSGRIMTSVDGSSWTSATSPTVEALLGLSYSNDRFVAVGEYGTIVSSADGLAWSANTGSDTPRTFKGAAAGAGRFTVVGEDGTIRTSSDGGATFTAALSGTTATLNAALFADGRFLAAGDNGTLITSSDAGTWSPQVSGTTRQLNALAWGAGRYVAVGANGTIITSTDGTTWAPATSGTTTALTGVKFGNSVFVALDAASVPLTSSDGLTWVAGTDLGAHPKLGFAFGQFIAMGGITGSYRTSPDGLTWTTRTLSFDGPLTAVANEFGVTNLGEGGESADGTSWTAVPLNVGYSELNAVAFLDGVYVVGGRSGLILSTR